MRVLLWIGLDLCGTTDTDELLCVGPVVSMTGGLASGTAVVDAHVAVDSWELVSAGGELLGGPSMNGYEAMSCEGQSGVRYPSQWSRWTGIAAIDGGYEHQCTLGTDGTLDCWGCMAGQPVAPPSGTYTAYASGEDHACVIDAAGTATCWGDDSYGQASPPAGSTFTAIEAGGFHTCGIRTDGEVECWGSGSAGQTTVP